MTRRRQLIGRTAIAVASGLLALAALEATLRQWPTALAVGAVLAVLSVVIQSRGAFVLATWFWNTQPSIETHADEKVWDWRSPQFAARRPPKSPPPSPLVE